MNIVFVMDPLEGIKPWKDTTYHIMLAAAQRAHRVFYMNQTDLFVEHDAVFGNVTELKVHDNEKNPFEVIERRYMPMAEADAVLIRTDPPFDRAYFYTTLLLDLLPPTTKVINRPSGLRNWNEKLAALIFPELTPTTLITQSIDKIHAFMAEHGKITLKPIDGFGGRGIVFLERNTPNLDQLIDMVTHGGTHRMVVQKYLAAAHEGDKRILLINGDPIGGILRVHQEGKELNNMDAGGTPHPVDLTEGDLHICSTLKPKLLEQGILFCGIDIIGGKLIEINVTSPTGLQELCRFSGKPYNHTIVEAVEQHQ